MLFVGPVARRSQYGRRMSRRGDHTAIRNRKARHDYEILDHHECGIVLEGAEVKSIRQGHANLQEAYARVEGGEVWLHGMHVKPYEFSLGDLDPVRPRKLLLHRREIDRLAGKIRERGLTLIPLQLYFSDGRAKVELALARGKRVHDKRRDIAEREARVRMQRALRRRGKRP
jgi:SsrA-binding protein